MADEAKGFHWGLMERGAGGGYKPTVVEIIRYQDCAHVREIAVFNDVDVAVGVIEAHNAGLTELVDTPGKERGRWWEQLTLPFGGNWNG